MQINRKQVLPLLTALTAMMVAPYSYGVAYTTATIAGAPTAYTLLNAGPDTMTVAAGETMTHTAVPVNMETQTTLTIAATGKVTTTGANAAVLGINANASANAITINNSGQIIANGTNAAIDLSAVLTNNPTSVMTIAATGSVVGDIKPNAGTGASGLTITGGTFTGDYVGGATASAQTITLTGGTITGRTAAGLTFTSGASDSTVTVTKNSTISANLIKTGANVLNMTVNDGSSVITGNISSAADGTITVGGVTIAGLKVAGTIDGENLNLQNGSNLYVTGVVGGTNVATFTTTTTADNTRTNAKFAENASFSTSAIGGADVTFAKAFSTTGVSNLTDASIVYAKSTYSSTGNVAVSDHSILNIVGNTTFSATLDVNTSGRLIIDGTVTIGGASTIATNAYVEYNGVVTANTTLGIADSVVKLNANYTSGGLITANTGARLYLAEKIAITGGTPNLSVLGGGVTYAMTGSSIAGTVTLADGAVFEVYGPKVSGLTLAQKSVSIGGTYTGVAGSSLNIVLNDGYKFGHLSVAGTTDLTGNVRLVIPGNGFVAAGSYRIISSVGALTVPTNMAVELPSVRTSDNSIVRNRLGYNVTFVATPAGNGNVVATVTRTNGFATFASKENAKSMFSAIDNGMTPAKFELLTEDQRTTFNVIENYINNSATINQASLDSVAESLVPMSTPSTVTSHALNASLGVVGSRLDAVAYGDHNYMAAGISSKSVWMRALASDVQQRATAEYSGYNARRLGAMLGFDAQMFTNSKIGIGLGFVNSRGRERADRLSTSNIRSYQFMPYGTFNLGNRSSVGYIDWMAAYVYNDIKTSQNVNLSALSGTVLNHTNTAAYNNSQFALKLTYALDKMINKNVTLVPFVSAGVGFQAAKSFTGTGPEATTTSVKSHTSLDLELGLKGVFKPETGARSNTRVILHAAGIWSPLSQDVKSTSKFVMNNAVEFVSSTKHEKFGGKFGASLVVEMLRNLDLELAYNLEARSKYLDHTGFVEFKYSF